MRVDLDENHEQLVRAAIEAGKAADAKSYIQSLIDDAAADGWVSDHQQQVEDRLRERLEQSSVERQRGDFEALRREVEGIVEQRRQGPAG